MRFVSPAILALSLVSLVLPWVEIRCDAGGQRMTLMQQTGIETVTGKVSLSKDFQNLAKLDEKQGKGGANAGPDLKKDTTSTAPLVLGWLGLVGVGILLGFIIGPGAGRKILLTAVTLGAVACLLVQGFVLKFPLKNDMDKEQAAKKQAAPAVPKDDPLKLGEPEVYAAFGSGYWIAIAGGVAALAVTCFEPTQAAGRRRRPENEDY